MTLSRRDLIKAGVFAGAAVALPLQRAVSGTTTSVGRMPATSLPKPFTIPFTVPPVAVPYRQDDTTDYYKMSMDVIQANVIPGFQTPMYAYNGSVPGPTIKAVQGREVVVRHYNNLPAQAAFGYEQATSVHLHSSASLPEYDGYASDITVPGQFKDYHYPNFQPARTLWYHDHGRHHTAENVYQGLAAQYHLSDPQEQALGLPKDEFDVPLIISDASFNADGSLFFTLINDSGMYGDVMMVNGRPWPAMKVKRRKYRFRILDACVSRSVNLSLDSGQPLTVIATEAGLMATPQVVTSLKVGMAERYEVIIDFSKYAAGKRVVLKNTSPKNNAVFTNTDKIMAFDVVGDAFDRSNNTIPSVLNPSNPAMLLTAADALRTRTIKLERVKGKWTVNGTTWDKVAASGFTLVDSTVQRGDVEIWEIQNDSGGWFHPFHIHLVDFQIISRNGKPPYVYEKGPKDVVYTGENERVQVLMRFEGLGKYMMHCHNLVHEDHDMMSQFEVVDPDPTVVGDDPFCQPPYNVIDEYPL